LRFFHGHMIDSPTGVVLLGSNKNRVGFMGRGRCSCSRLISMSAWIGASVGVMSLFTTVVAPTISLQRVLGSLGPLNTLIPSSRSLGIVGARNHLTLRGRESLSSCLRPWLKMYQHGAWSYYLTDADAPAYACAPSLLCDSLTQESCSPSLGSSQSLEPPKHRPAHHSGHSRNTPISSHQCRLHAGRSKTVE
jgi:hypothetical protein